MFALVLALALAAIVTLMADARRRPVPSGT
jgi:hypothetical protein